MEYIVKIISIRNVTHNVKQIVIEKPKGFIFTPGQATDLTINEKKFRELKNPFTFTCLNSDPCLEFTIKIYPDSEEGVTKRISQLSEGAELIISDAWGAIEYKGPGYFIAGGQVLHPLLPY